PPLRNVRLGDALAAIARNTDKPIQYSIWNHGVVISQKLPEAVQLRTRIFDVDPQTFIQRLASLDQGKAEAQTNPAERAQKLVGDYLEAAGVSLQPPNYVFFDNRTGMLKVRASAEELDRVQKAIDALSSNKPVDEAPATSDRKDRAESEKPKPDNSSAALETRIFRVDPTTFFEDAHRFLFEAGWSDIEIFGQSNDWRLSIIRKLCESLEVSHLPPNTILYTYSTIMLMLRATADELDRIQKAIESLTPLRQKESANQS